ncbi:cobalamin biosynthesis protein CobW [Cellulomonas sp. APG4]|uniref:CobW family GTP-binding protein n=1 Tax=Cellulomonas sp. APG4 TaxID=1538656 RepID=UPI00137B55F8|nr:GTP-binding protein [Cellulomonas sp. APG4]NCT91540.1 cobalamin biosynthesis protein CobW [Cellulomonas sp. APG4]
MSHRLPLTVLTSVDPVLRDSLVLGFLMDVPSGVVLQHDIHDDGVGGGEIRRLVLDRDGVVEDARVPLEHACLSCAVREDAVPRLRELAADGRWDAVALALPVSAESLPVARALDAEVRRGGLLTRLRLSAVTAGVDLDALHDDLLGDDLIDERGLALTQDDRRAVGEAVAAQLAHADVVVTHGTDATGSALLEHVRALDGRRVDGLHELDVRRLLAGHHDARAGEARLDPLQVSAPRHRSAPGAWTVELRSSRPFHPERFVEDVEQLAAGPFRGRGVFWVANRPDTVCVWDAAGGQLSIGALGTWGRRRPETHLVVTGAGGHAPDLRTPFEHLLLTDAEMAEGLGPWLGAEDVLEPWLGARQLG